MEALYTKLYNKYTNLKNEKESKLDKLNRDQEAKFVKFAATADEIIQHLKSENERLWGQVGELERASNEQKILFEKLLEEENRKNEELSEEISRFQKRRKTVHSTELIIAPNADAGQEDTSGKSVTKLMKKRKTLHTTEGTVAPNADAGHDRPTDQHVYGGKGSGNPHSIEQPACCQKKIYGSGGDATGNNSSNCVFQHLVEYVVGMKLSPVTQSKELCILVNHNSSGYSFSLTWITNSGGEIELMYRVLSLGTLERVAPEWMKDTIIFSTSMCQVFFERLSRVVKS